MTSLMSPISRKNTKNYYLAIAPGASYTTKAAPKNIFIQLIQRISDTFKNNSLYLVFLGDKKDKVITSSIISSISPKLNIIDFTGNLSLPETAYIISQSSCLLGNDSSNTSEASVDSCTLDTR